MMKVSQGKADPALTHKVVDNCTRLLEWLHSDCGINFKTVPALCGRSSPLSPRDR